MPHDQDDLLLERVLALDDLASGTRVAFEDMAEKRLKFDGALTDKQRAWAEAMLAGVRYEPAPEYENLISTGRAPRGREVPSMVGALPKRPPRKVSGEEPDEVP